MKIALSYLALCDLMDYSPSGSSVHGILQARIPEWVAISSSRQCFSPRDQTCISCIAGRFFIKIVQFSSVAQSCPTLCDCVDCCLLGSSVFGILQARILEWVAISFSRVSS